MPLTDSFYSNLSSGNARRIRIMMKDSLLIDHSFNEFSEMEYAARDMAGLYDTHDGRELNYDKTAWNDSYMNKLMVQIVGNFSHERVAHLKEVVRYLRPVENNEMPGQSKEQIISEYSKQGSRTKSCCNDHKEETCNRTRNGSSRRVKTIGGTIIGGVFGGSIASVFSASIIGGAIVGAALGAVIVTFTTKGEV